MAFVKHFKRITKQLGFHLTFKTADLQDIIYTTLGDGIKVNFIIFFNTFQYFFPMLKQILFNDYIENSFTFSFDSWSTERKTVDTQLDSQVDIGSAQNINSPNYLIVTCQTAARIRVPNKANYFAVFDNLDVRKYHVDIDGVRCRRDGVCIDYASNDYVNHYRHPKLFYKDYLGEQLPNSFLSYTDMKNNYPMQVIDLRFQVDHINPKKIQLLQEYRSATNNARLFMILIRHRQIKLISDMNKITEVTLI